MGKSLYLQLVLHILSCSDRFAWVPRFEKYDNLITIESEVMIIIKV